jgi:hypothetical protein
MTPWVRIVAHWQITENNTIHLCSVKQTDIREQDRRRVQKETLTGYDQVAGVIGIWDLLSLGK